MVSSIELKEKFSGSKNVCSSRIITSSAPGSSENKFSFMQAVGSSGLGIIIFLDSTSCYQSVEKNYSSSDSMSISPCFAKDISCSY